MPCNHTRDVALRYAHLSGLDEAPGGCNSYSPGSAINWQYHAFGTAAFVVQLPERALRESEVRRHARAAFTLAGDHDAGDAGS